MLNKKITSIFALLIASHEVFAGSAYYLVVPLSSSSNASSNTVSVSLNTAVIPDAISGSPYSFSLASLLNITDSNPNPSLATFTAAGLPAGFSLNSSGLLTASPTQKSLAKAPFSIEVSYKGANANKAYSILTSGPKLNATKVSTGTQSSCALTPGGAVKCWGFNGYGQIGDNTTTNYNAPVTPIGLSSGVVDVQVGDMFACALLSTGSVKCWGRNNVGMLGNGVFNTNPTKVPTQVSGLTSGVTQIAVGYQHACAVTATGDAYCWGLGFGGLGNGTTSHRNVPTLVAGGHKYSQIAVGAYHSCGLLLDKTVKCWGVNPSGELGTGDTSTSLTPITVPGLSDVKSISTALNISCAVTNSGAAYCWGDNTKGRVGDGTSGNNRLSPVLVSGFATGMSSIRASWYSTCGITTSGASVCWGPKNMFLDYVTYNTVPTPVAGLESGVTAVSSSDSGYFGCAVVSGIVKCWGHNTYPAIATGGDTPGDFIIPEPVTLNN